MTIEKILALPRDGLATLANMTDEELKAHIGEIVTLEATFKDGDYLYKKFAEAEADEDNPIVRKKSKKTKKKDNMEEEGNKLLLELGI